MEEHYTVWSIFHDGGIDQIDGEVPGSLKIKVNIDYIRHIFSKDGNAIWVNVKSCETFQYEPWDERPVIFDPKEIEKMAPEILSMEPQLNGEVFIYCNSGILRAKYQGASYKLDNGESISLGDLKNACDRYWSKGDGSN